MTDRELLEAAAKAAGYWSEEYGCPDRLPNRAWDPLTNDADALALAIRLRLHVEPGERMVRVGRPGREIGWGKVVAWETYEEKYGEAYAVRRAIVRAAAMLANDYPPVVFVPPVPVKEHLAAPAEAPEGVPLRRGEIGRWG